MRGKWGSKGGGRKSAQRSKEVKSIENMPYLWANFMFQRKGASPTPWTILYQARLQPVDRSRSWVSGIVNQTVLRSDHTTRHKGVDQVPLRLGKKSGKSPSLGTRVLVRHLCVHT